MAGSHAGWMRPPRFGLLDLLDEALDAGWTLRRVCHELELPERRAHRWIARRAGGRLADRAPGGSPMHGLLEQEVAEILALFDEWGETDRSHRKLAHRGSYLHRVWVSASSVRRVLFLHDKHFRPLPRPGRSVRKPFPDWVDYKPNSIWIYDTTHFTAAGMAVLIIEDLVSRKWLATVVSVEETSTQVEVGFTDALDREGLLELVEAHHDDGTVDLGRDPADPARRLRQRTTDGVAIDAGVHGHVRDRPTLRAPRHPDRPGLDRKPQRAPQGRVPAPARHPRPGHPARRAGDRADALQRGQAPRRHRPTTFT